MQVVLRSTLALTVANGFSYVVSLAEVPILARALGATSYGELIWVQLTALLASWLVEYGFNLSTSRTIAQAQHDRRMLRSIAGNVFLARLILLIVVTPPLVLLYLRLVPVTADLALAGFIYFVAFGLNPFWYFQGLQKMGRAVAVEILTRSVALVGLLIFVRTPEDVAIALWIMASGAMACTLITTYLCVRQIGLPLGTIAGAWAEIRHGAPIFIYKSSSNLAATAATTILGTIAGKAAVGIFGPSEKVIKAVVGMVLPVLNAFYPHLSRLFVQDQRKKDRQAMLLTLAVAITGLASALILTQVGPELMHWLLGPGFESAGALLQLMVWLIPLRLINQTLGFAILLPAGHERQASIHMLSASIGSLALGAWLTIDHGAWGMVWGLVIGETALLIAQLILVRYVSKGLRSKMRRP